MSDVSVTTPRRAADVPGVSVLPGTSPIVTAGGFAFVGGVMAADCERGLDPAVVADPAAPFLADALEAQSRVVLERAGAALRAAGLDLRRDVIRIWQWVPARYPSDEDYAQGPLAWPRFRPIDGYARAVRELIGDGRRSSTGIGVRQLPVPGALLQVDLMAVAPCDGVEKETFDGDVAERAAYAPATRFGDWVFLAGNGATDFRGDWMASAHMGEPSMVAPEARVNPYIWLGSEIEAQTEFTLGRLARIAESAGTSLERCVKADVTLGHPSDYLGFERVWRRWFGGRPPARTVTTGARLVVKGVRVEIAMVLLADDAELSIERVETDAAPPALGHAPQAVRAGELLFLSGRLPVGADGRVPEALLAAPGSPFVRRAARAQAEALLDDVAAICEAGGGSLAEVCKVQAFHRDLGELPDLLDAWRGRFPAGPPALSALGMGGGDPLLAPGAALSLDVIAHAPRAR